MKTANKTLILAALAALTACADNIGLPEQPEQAGPARFTAEVPIELVRYVAGNGTVYDGLPPAFPPLDLPAALQPLGAMDYGVRQRVVFGADGSAREARELLGQAFLAREGWRELENRPARRDVFVAPGQAPFDSQPVLEICHDEYGSLLIQANEEEGIVTLNRDLPQPGPGSWCELQAQRRQRFGFVGAEAMSDFLPSLSMPAEAESFQRSFSSGGLDEWETGILLNGEDYSLRELARHFGDQMEAQGWERDAQWRGDLSAGATWVRDVEEGRRALAFLEVREIGNDEFGISFRMDLL